MQDSRVGSASANRKDQMCIRDRDEALTVTPDFHKKALALLPQGLPVEYIPHTELKERSRDAKAIVLTLGVKLANDGLIEIVYQCRKQKEYGVL